MIDMVAEAADISKAAAGRAVDAGDGCNMCICNDGLIECTEMACDNLNLEDN